MRLLLPVLCIVTVTAAASPQIQPPDSSVVQLQEVVVTATRSDLPLQDSPSPVEIIPIEDEKRLEGGSVGDVLVRSTGLFLQDLGGSGALKTAFVRGGAPSELLVLVDGNRINSYQNGLVDLSLLPLGMVDRIEVVRGGASALYGADALAGVVNILTRTSTPDLHGRAEAGIGSYGFERWSAEAGGGIGNMSVLGGISREKGSDNYPFVLSRSGIGDTTMRRQNSDFDLRQFYLHADGARGSETRFSLAIQGIRSDRGVPGSLSFPSNEARQTDDGATAIGSFRTLAVSGMDLQLKAGFQYSREVYADPNPSFPLNVSYRNALLTINPQIGLLTISGFQSVLGIEFHEGVLRGDDFQGHVGRVERALYTSNEYHLTFDRNTFDRLSLYAMLRYDAISDVGHALTPKVGFNLRISKRSKIVLRGSYGESYRAPTFNDLYYVGLNNPDLKPERSRNVDLGLAASAGDEGQHMLEVSLFSMSTENRILFDLVSYRPENIGRSRSQGVEGMYNGVFLSGLVNIAAQYSLTDTRKLNRESGDDPSFDKHLLYIPVQLASVSAGIGDMRFRVELTHSLVGRRYITGNNSQSLSPYQLTDVGGTAGIPADHMKVMLTISLKNILNRRYMVFPDYPMPGRTLRFGLAVDY